MTPKKAEELVKKWIELRNLVDQDSWVDNAQSPAILEMLLILMELQEVGYHVNDNGQWYHSSEAN